MVFLSNSSISLNALTLKSFIYFNTSLAKVTSVSQIYTDHMNSCSLNVGINAATLPL